MRSGLKISLISNLVLAIVIGWFAIRNDLRLRSDSDTPPMHKKRTGESSSISVRQSPSEILEWSQIESTNYQTYIANLRSVGCPEQTLREIIKADVQDLYNSRREHRERLDGSLSSAAAFEQLRTEEAEVLRELLGTNVSVEDTIDNGATNADVQVQTPQQKFKAIAERRDLGRPVTLPLVLQQVDPGALKMSADQLNIIEALRRQFEQEIGGLNQDPNDPAYLKQWQVAQHNADELMGVLLGRDFRAHYQVEAMKQ